MLFRVLNFLEDNKFESYISFVKPVGFEEKNCYTEEGKALSCRAFPL